MALDKITQVSGRGVYIAGNDIDTDRIIPARFLKCVTFDGLGAGLFADDRKADTAAGKVHPLDNARFAGAKILISNSNFGCGSSREHAPQALQKFGLRAVIAEGFAEIFFGNSTTIGLTCVCAQREDIAKLTAAIEADPQLDVIVDVMAQEVRFGGRTIKTTQRESSRNALINGKWDPIGDLLDGAPAVAATASRLPYIATR